MAETWRLLDTGLASAARNIALSRALLEARHAEEIPSTLRFMRFSPSALLGCHQSAHHELDRAWCAAKGIEIQRRITGGGAWYVDERHLGWELYLHRRDVNAGDTRDPAGMQAVGKRILHAAATALAALGVDARYRARDEIEIDGRTLCAGAYAVEGEGVLYQAMAPLDLDAACAAHALRLPVAGEDAAAAVRQRYAGLADALGRRPDVHLVKSNLAEAFESEFNVEFRDGDLNLSEHARCQPALREIETAGWVDLVTRPQSDMPVLEGVRKVGAGLLRATLKYEPAGQTIRQVWFSGDLRASPRRTLNDLEAALRDSPMSGLARRIESFFAGRPARFEGLEAHDFAAVVRLAAGQPLAA